MDDRLQPAGLPDDRDEDNVSVSFDPDDISRRTGSKMPEHVAQRYQQALKLTSRVMVCPPSVVVHDLHLPGMGCIPNEANPPLVVDADAVLSRPVAQEGLQPVARWHPQEVEIRCRVQLLLLRQSRPSANLQKVVLRPALISDWYPEVFEEARRRLCRLD